MKNIKNNANLEDLYRDWRNTGIISDKTGKEIQIFKIMGSADSNDYNKHKKELEILYRKTNDKNAQIRAQSIKLNPQIKKRMRKDV